MLGTDRNNLVTNITIKNVEASKLSIGIHMAFTRNILVEDTFCTQNSYYGILLGFTWLITTDDPAVEVYPICRDLLIKNSRFDRNVSMTGGILANPADTFNFDFISGIGLYYCQNVLINNCTVNDNTTDTFLLAAYHEGCTNT